MAKKLTIRTVRIAANLFEFDKTLTDSNSSASPASWRGNPLRIEMAIFEKTGADPLDLSGVTQLVVSAKSEKSDSAAFVFSAIALIAKPLITRDEWTNGDFNAAVEIPGTLLDLAPANKEESVELYITITATTTAGHEVTIEVGSLVIHEDFNNTDPSILGDWRIDPTYGPVFFDSVGWTNASGAPIDGHTKPDAIPGYTYPATPNTGDFEFNTNLRHAVWYDGVGWINETGAPVDGHTKPAADAGYVRPAYAAEGSMEYDRNLRLPIWKIGGTWTNSTQAPV